MSNIESSGPFLAKAASRLDLISGVKSVLLESPVSTS